LLIGMMQEGENVAALVMKKMGIEPDEPREVFESQLPATGKIAEQAPLTDRARVAMRLAQEQAIGLGQGYLGCEHLLMGLLLETSGVANQILQSLGVTVEGVRAEVVKLVQGSEEWGRLA